MKKVLCCVASVLLMCSLVACGQSTPPPEFPEQSVGSSETTSPEISAPPAVSSKPAGFDADAVVEQLEVREFQYNSRYANYAFVTVKNNSEYDLDISADFTLYDEAGSIIGAESRSQEAVESGHEILLWFMPDEPYAKMEYEFSAQEEDLYECVLSDLSYEASETKGKVILSITNNGEKPAEFVQANVLFFNGGQAVGHDFSYATDDDHELKPGKTKNVELSCREDFDSYEVFFTGRRY